MNRRRFAKTIAGAAALTFTGGRLLAAPGAQSRFLLVFLRGGYDAANLLVPISSDFYYQSRPEIAIAASASWRSNEARIGPSTTR